MEYLAVTAGRSGWQTATTDLPLWRWNYAGMARARELNKVGLRNDAGLIEPVMITGNIFGIAWREDSESNIVYIPFFDALCMYLCACGRWKWVGKM